MRRVLIAASLAAISAGCGPSKEDEERATIVARIEAITAIPAKDFAGRARAAEALRATAATTPEAIAARDLCAEAYGALAEGMRLTAAAEEGIRPGSTADPALAIRAGEEAGRLLQAVGVDIDRCGNASAALRLRR